MKGLFYHKEKEILELRGDGEASIGHGRARTAALPTGEDKAKQPAKANKRQCGGCRVIRPNIVGCISVKMPRI